MKVPIRKTLTGTEYWDTEAKKTLFVSAGKKPDFEVTKDPKSMIGGVDLAGGKDMTAIDGELLKREHLGEWVGPNWDDMNVKQLMDYAKQKDIQIPGNMKKEDTIRKYIADALADTK